MSTHELWGAASQMDRDVSLIPRPRHPPASTAVREENEIDDRGDERGGAFTMPMQCKQARHRRRPTAHPMAEGEPSMLFSLGSLSSGLHDIIASIGSELHPKVSHAKCGGGVERKAKETFLLHGTELLRWLGCRNPLHHADIAWPQRNGCRSKTLFGVPSRLWIPRPSES